MFPQLGRYVNGCCHRASRVYTISGFQTCILHRPHLPAQVGVGTSVLQLEMTLDGYRHVHNVDYSEVLIRHMQEQHAGIPQITYELADCRLAPLPRALKRASIAGLKHLSFCRTPASRRSLTNWPTAAAASARVLRFLGSVLLQHDGMPILL